MPDALQGILVLESQVLAHEIKAVIVIAVIGEQLLIQQVEHAAERRRARHVVETRGCIAKPIAAPVIL